MLKQQRRNSQRLASVLDAMTEDLDFNTKEVSSELEEDVAQICSSIEDVANYCKDAEGWKDLSEEDKIQMVCGGDDEEDEEDEAEAGFSESDEDEFESCEFADEDEDEFESCEFADEDEDEFESCEFADDEEEIEEDDEEEETTEASEVEPGIEDTIGNEMTGGSPGGDRSLSKEKELIGDGNSKFDNDENYEDSIRNVVAARKAKIKSFIARLDAAATELESTGSKTGIALAYKLDMISDKLEKKYLK